MAIFDQRYEQEELLGRGAFSEVWKVKDIQTGVTLALKIYNPTTGIDEDGKDMLTHEFALMVNAYHKNLLRPLFFAVSGDRPYLILPFCEQGNIGKMVGKMDEEEAWKLMRDCASALAYLHGMNPPVLHQDIKPANILLNDNGDYMLTDFGVSTQVKQSLSRVSHQDMALLSAGTISYMAPERFSRNNLPVMANDIYSLGSTVYELTTGTLPFGVDGGLLQRKGAEIPELPGDFSPLLKKTLDSCLQEEPWQRPTAEQLEEIATRAIRHPELRNAVPNTEPAAKATTMQLPEEYLQPASSPAGCPADNPAKGTVVGAYPNGANPTEPKKSGKTLYIIIAVLIVAAMAAGGYFLIGNDQLSASAEETHAISADSLKRLAEAQEFETCMVMFNQDSPDSIQSAIGRMAALAQEGNKDAIHEMAYTYAWIPNDTESDRRKRLLGLEINSNGIPTNDINEVAILWLEKSIAVTDSADYKSLYWLSFYYLNSIVVKQDFAKAIQLLQTASRQAEQSQDIVFKVKIDETIRQINSL
ncbi:MAG: protein kinase [Prevotella sp.]|nr:protein kinase [Prevotella sp.]